MGAAIVRKRPSSAPGDDEQTRRIKAAIRARGIELRRRYPLLRRQNEIGLVLQLLAFGGMVTGACLYAAGVLPAWAAIASAAFLASIAHEIEHDLIHKLYYPRHPRVANALLALGWLMRPSTINPWVRRELHLLHHKISGTLGDVEERSISNGEPMGARRLLMMADGFCSVLLRPLPPGTRWFFVKRAARAFFPLGFVHYGIWYAFLLFHAVDLGARVLGTPLAHAPLVLRVMGVVDFLTVVLVAPNVLRSFCLNFVSSSLHYFGDVAEGDVLRQTQVLTPWCLLPFQLFCVNFGATHAIHHFWVPEPFYLRQLTAPAAHAVMRANGVRFNDLGTFRRANRYGYAEPVEA